MKNKIPVLYVGEQVGATDDEILILVDDPAGSTKVFRPDIHEIVGVSTSALSRGFKVSDDLAEAIGGV